MLFNSLEFAIFFPVVTILFFVLPHRFQWLLLLAASCFFYMFFKPVYILILAFTIVIDYFAGIWIYRQPDKRKKRHLLMLSIIANVGVLAVFKYYNFIAINLNEVLDALHSNDTIPLLKILLPIGLSFHTFQAMSYTIEIYRGHQLPEKHFGIYALYVMFYPQLVAGPIERPQNMLYQFHEDHKFDYDNMRSGLIQIAWGLFKKMVIADRLALFVNQVYGSPHGYTGLPLIIATIFFAFQIYCDFSGYSDIALGTARCMGFTLMTNFNKPFVSRNITEFWRRWHISLSSWFYLYLFDPLVFATRNWRKWAVVFSLMVTFLLSGLWHGAGWTFIIYGGVHGIAVSYEFLTKRFRQKIAKRAPAGIYNGLSRLITFLFVAWAWIFFRARTLTDARYIIRKLFVGLPGQLRDVAANLHFARLRLLYLDQSLNEFIIALIAIGFLVSIQYQQKDQSIDEWLEARPRPLRWVFYYGLPLACISFGIFNGTQFIYFQF
jgi:alginate O-acetyltransferase complex protein AlgI